VAWCSWRREFVVVVGKRVCGFLVGRIVACVGCCPLVVLVLL
jgi:hypothetical protein